MDTRDIQAVLKAAGHYHGALDGIAGRQTWQAVDRALAPSVRIPAEAAVWPSHRRMIAAAQAALNRLGHEAGAVDGLEGHNTREAMTAFRLGPDAAVARRPRGYAPASAATLPRQSECADVYGPPGEAIRPRLVTAPIPVPLVLDYDLDQTVTRVTLHRRCHPAFCAALEAVRDHYGTVEMARLGLNRYAGGFNPRRMRGGTEWSMHAYGCAVDFYAAPNALRMRCPEARFCGPEYRAFLDIMESHGWLPAIRLWGADAMHFQMARLG